jgi:uncharacterized protein YbjT (DUF2867 family)
VFITGGTGYVGQKLIPLLVERRHQVMVLARPGSESRIPAGAIPIAGDGLRADSFVERVRPADTFVHLVGTPHPAPWKEKQFRAVDLVSALASLKAAVCSDITHLIYVSVAHPAPIMKAYIAVRRECEAAICASGIPATILRPWYILGPGHQWPIGLLPIYWLLEQLPSTRDAAGRLGLVTLDQMVHALLQAVEHPCEKGQHILDVPHIRQCSRTGPG